MSKAESIAERESGYDMAARLAAECLDEVANFEAQQALLERGTGYQEAKIFYRKDCPDKTLVPAVLLDSYRKKIFLRVCGDIYKDPTDPEVAPEVARLAAETFEEKPAQQYFPWLHYSQGADAYVVDSLSLSLAFEMDYHQEYPVIAEREEQ